MLKDICTKLKQRRKDCNFTNEDYLAIKEDLKKENDGEFVKKKFLSMRHLVQNHPQFDVFRDEGKNMDI